MKPHDGRPGDLPTAVILLRCLKPQVRPIPHDRLTTPRRYAVREHQRVCSTTEMGTSSELTRQPDRPAGQPWRNWKSEWYLTIRATVRGSNGCASAEWTSGGRSASTSARTLTWRPSRPVPCSGRQRSRAPLLALPLVQQSGPRDTPKSKTARSGGTSNLVRACTAGATFLEGVQVPWIRRGPTQHTPGRAG